jgi:hypothetical protein
MMLAATTILIVPAIGRTIFFGDPAAVVDLHAGMALPVRVAMAHWHSIAPHITAFYQHRQMRTDDRLSLLSSEPADCGS